MEVRHICWVVYSFHMFSSAWANGKATTPKESELNRRKTTGQPFDVWKFSASGHNNPDHDQLSVEHEALSTMNHHMNEYQPRLCYVTQCYIMLYQFMSDHIRHHTSYMISYVASYLYYIILWIISYSIVLQVLYHPYHIPTPVPPTSQCQAFNFLLDARLRSVPESRATLADRQLGPISWWR